MEKTIVIPQDMKFEAALKHLEEISAALSSGSVMLDESLVLYEEGIHYLHYCRKKLKETEMKFEEINTRLVNKEDGLDG